MEGIEEEERCEGHVDHYPGIDDPQLGRNGGEQSDAEPDADGQEDRVDGEAQVAQGLHPARTVGVERLYVQVELVAEPS